MTIMLRLGLLLLLSSVLAFEYEKYSSYRLVKATPKTRQQVQFLGEYGDNNKVDFWSGPALGMEAEIFVGHEEFGRLKSALYANGMTFKISDRDISAELKVEWEGLVSRGRPDSRIYDINDYNTYDDIMGEVDRLATLCSTATPLACTTSVFGSSVEGRELKQITVTSGNANGIIVFDSLIHAREWLAGATVMNILDKMINGYGSDADVTRLLDAYDFVFVPVMNPDGYEYTWTNDRMWRKNRVDNAGTACDGVDLNRNYEYGWGGQGSSGSECSETYRGPSAASEVETQAYVAFILGLSTTPIAGITYHTHGYYFLYPYGDCSAPPFEADVMQVTNAACAAIEGTFGENWLCGNSCEELYATAGTTQDWFTGGAGIKYGITPELRNDGYGFQPPASSIAPSVEQMWNGMVAMVDEIILVDG